MGPVLHKCQSLFPLTITLTNNNHGMADRCLWQQKAFFLNGNLAEKRRAGRLGMIAHLLLAHSAQSVPPAQPDSRLCLLTVPAKPLLGSRPGRLLLEAVPAVWPSFTTSVDFRLSLPLTSQCPPHLLTSHLPLLPPPPLGLPRALLSSYP